jgi:hypothetical protein
VRWFFEAGQNSEQRGLAAAGATEDREQFALSDVEVDIVDGNKVAKQFAHTTNTNKAGIPGVVHG